uniref:Uncharacterized protein n=1 Tax=Cajanus cajan TaxID=3821 RepID=A0A151TPA1_CAJCA|nr:hypothetical protein KK1_022532 [Cajanus cajan]
MPWRKLSKLVNGSLCLLDEPVHSLAWSVIAKPVLNIIELNGCVCRESNSAVAWPFGSVNLAVAIFSTCGPNNVSSFYLNNLPYTAPHAP